MKQRRIMLLFAVLGLLVGPACPLASDQAPPADCSAYPAHPARGTCENARKFGLSFDTAQKIEALAAHEHAFGFCGAAPDADFRRRVAERLAQDSRLRALYDEQLTMLEHRCVYDPDGWCRSMGFERR